MKRTSPLAETLASYPEEIRYLILALQRQGNRKLNNLFAQLDLTTSQSETIEVIGMYGPMSTREVGEYLICESGSPSRLLATLAAKGLTVTSRSVTDRRATLHALTPKGREMVERIKDLKRSFQDELAASLAEVENRYPEDLLTQLTFLLEDPDLVMALKNRYPRLFSRL